MNFHPIADYITFHPTSGNIQSFIKHPINLAVYHGTSQQQIEIPKNAYNSSSLMHAAAAAKCMHEVSSKTYATMYRLTWSKLT
jgi:hypothetical protein